MSAKPTVLLTGPRNEEHGALIALLEGSGLDVRTEHWSDPRAMHVNGTRPAVIVLDADMPPPGGVDIVQALQRASEFGVIVLCDKADPVDCILGLEAGADDVVERNRDPREVAARVRRLLARGRALRDAAAGDRPIIFSDWRLSLERRELTDSQGQRVHLTRGEFELLAALAGRQGKVLSRDQLLDYISHRDWAPSDRTVDVLVNRLRHKIGDNPREPRHLITVHGVGYAFQP
ncbi:hypothetical protein C882_0695 [Caenispirillum salinarum AK4]|uniref:Regulatory protein VirG n=1 Tax=Caenispirillum salinarum AK4 TaxID=1238182 RepID=K9HJZ0_9PROT|nr:response regulator transcription factor [Caenispirillum salinarum]EKV28931.1 hypothetical protein C882_0695 [Caenispirillum salinarum AK4]